MHLNVALNLRLAAAIALAAGAPFSAGAAAVTDAAALWAGKVQPLFDVYCVKCHGPIEQKSGLELDQPEAVLKGGDDGEVVVPGYPEKSRLYLYLDPKSDPHMPPKKQLSAAQQEVVREWITALKDPTKKASKTAKTEKAPKTRKFESATQAIDVYLAEGWKESGIKPAAPVDDRTWCRRVYLDLAGRIPTPAEVDQFVASRSRTKRATLVDQLIASEDYVVRMRELWDTFLMGRTKREAGDERRRQAGWWTFLESAFRTNRPWNETVREFLVARPASNQPENKGASWFLYERRNEHQAIAEAVAPVVYGTKIDCAQCHDHPLAREIKQAHYWGLVAAFNRSKNIERGSDVAESAVGGFINFTNLRKESQPALITMLDGSTIEEPRPTVESKEPEKEAAKASGEEKEKAKEKGKRKGKDKEKEKDKDSDDNYVDPKAEVRVPKFSRRAAFAEAATRDNPLLARAFVNRMWAVLFGRGIVNPADEINARNAPSHPELLDWLTQDFASHGYDVRRLLRGMVLSRAYALGFARAGAAAGPEKFASALERPLSAEQLAQSWRIAAGLTPNDETLRRRTVAALPDVMPREYNATFQQAQFLTHSPAMAEILKPEAEGVVKRLAAVPSPQERARQAFLAVYGRVPDAEESRQTVEFLKARSSQPGQSGQPAEGVRDLLWALLTSAEFLTMP